MKAFPLAIVVAFATAGCGGGGSTGAVTPPGSPLIPQPSASVAPSASPGTTPTPTPTSVPAAKITHIVIIVQENRTFDNLFDGYPGADTVASGTDSHGQTVALQPTSYTAPADISHSHGNWLTQYAGGKLAFDLGSPKGQSPDYPFGYVPRSETALLWKLAGAYTIGDRMFQSNTGPSFPAHQYLIAGSSQIGNGQYADENPDSPDVWGCDSPAGTTVSLLGPNGANVTGPYPCFDYPTLGDELDAKSIGWRYYAPAIGASGAIWSAYDAIRHIRFGADWTQKVISPETNVLGDAAGGLLPGVTWVAPSGANSDHAGSRSTSGPQWVASIVNAVAAGPNWNSTAIFVTWDDWGGWFDHVVPPQIDAMGLGFRVPLLVISPYAKRGYVSHVQHEFGSIVKFTERTFGLQPLGASDMRADDLSDCFDFTAAPQPYVPLSVGRAPESFRHAPEAHAPDE